MRKSLIAAGSALLTAAALFGTTGTAAADIWADWKHSHPKDCGVGLNEDTTYHHVTHHGVFAGTRNADGCKDGGHHGHHGGHHGDHWYGQYGDHDEVRRWLHRNWPTSGNGNWVGHGLGTGAGAGVGG